MFVSREAARRVKNTAKFSILLNLVRLKLFEIIYFHGSVA